ncbi:MAG: tRNA (uridine(34)/cytosine(34)/5-carboxymethylaminomethyluridine(34)-2'-O)-methyltransferase TrmL [Firmicutes bacterium]|nr:tRNA (uridine(34)/cytosine(34)/5-carboxymethylaminomethyluridine(34)-2'-O)-methyltransferase TrmL [Bacillota bacterium]
MYKIVLVEPEIAPNTGNVARLCAATRTELHLVHPLGFVLNDRKVKRAGLDYWSLVTIREHNSLDHFWQHLEAEGAGFHLLSTKGNRSYTEVSYRPGDYLIFGPETRGLPEELLKRYWEHTLRIPMYSEARSLNLSNSVAIVTYEALRQQGFPGLI